nr:MAG TPA: hypothetical protein [Caudoviricetes sp.]
MVPASEHLPLIAFQRMTVEPSSIRSLAADFPIYIIFNHHG